VANSPYALHALTTAPQKARYVVTSGPFLNLVLNNAPKRFTDRLIAGQLGLMPKKSCSEDDDAWTA